MLAVFGKEANFFNIAVADGFLTEEHTVAVFRVIFKQRVCPRRAFAGFVLGVRSRRRGASPDRRASGGVSNIHSVAEKLSYKLCIRSFTAACASTGEFEKRTAELTSFKCGCFEFIKYFGLFGYIKTVFKYLLFAGFLLKRFHFKRFCTFFTGADINAGTASGAVKRRNSHCKVFSVYTGHRK